MNTLNELDLQAAAIELSAEKLHAEQLLQLRADTIQHLYNELTDYPNKADSFYIDITKALADAQLQYELDAARINNYYDAIII